MRTIVAGSGAAGSVSQAVGRWHGPMLMPPPLPVRGGLGASSYSRRVRRWRAGPARCAGLGSARPGRWSSRVARSGGLLVSVAVRGTSRVVASGGRGRRRLGSHRAVSVRCRWRGTRSGSTTRVGERDLPVSLTLDAPAFTVDEVVAAGAEQNARWSGRWCRGRGATRRCGGPRRTWSARRTHTPRPVPTTPTPGRG